VVCRKNWQTKFPHAIARLNIPITIHREIRLQKHDFCNDTVHVLSVRMTRRPAHSYIPRSLA
jgi:hypothetical protein